MLLMLLQVISMSEQQIELNIHLDTTTKQRDELLEQLNVMCKEKDQLTFQLTAIESVCKLRNWYYL